jgi:CDP-diacylglycerol--glycerol-3-phosphate 3-phosphatidyltransferase
MIDGRRNEARTQEQAAPRGIGDDVGKFVVHLGFSADAVTALGVALSAVTAVVIGLGHLWTGVGLLIVGGLMDTLDGVVAKAAGTTSKRGAFFDSVADRIADGLIFAGVAWYVMDRYAPHWAILPIALLAMSAVVSYQRAKAESLGFTARGGLMERAERLIFLGVALAFNVVLLPLLGVLLALTTVTAIGRFRKVWVQASEPVRHRTSEESARRSAELRWRNWRASARADALRRRKARGELEPLSIRLRAVLRSDRTGDPAARVRRHGGRRDRAVSSSRRRLDSSR